MGKQAKKKVKSEAEAAKQKRHNRATKHSNTKNRPVLWEKRTVIKKDKDGNRTEETVEVWYPRNTRWDWSRMYDPVTLEDGVTKLLPKKNALERLHEPFDTLLEDWEEGIRSYAEDKHAAIERNTLADGRFEYVVFTVEHHPILGAQKLVKNVHLTVVSPRSIHFSGKKKFSKRRK